MATKRGPRDIAKATLTIAEGMTGEPLSEEIADLVTDAIWDAFVAGRESMAKPRRTRKASLSAPATDGGTTKDAKGDE
jgi:hypothetical protein